MRSNRLFLGVGALSLLVAGSAFAANHYVSLEYGVGWVPNEITINLGDTVFFINNIPGNSIYVSQGSGGCLPWSVGPIPWLGQGSETFLLCPEGVETYWDDVTFSSGIIHIVIPQTPTPDLTPATSPAGIGVIIAIMSFLIAIPVLRKTK
jgi:hypothetical protein